MTTAIGNEAGFAGLVACSRFEKEMTEGGAGAQAVALFPIELARGPAEVALRPAAIEVTPDVVVIHGHAG
jgi:hypothetical protein